MVHISFDGETWATFRKYSGNNIVRIIFYRLVYASGIFNAQLKL